MNSRHRVLGRIRAALGDRAAAPAEVPRDYRPAGAAVELDLLVHRLTDYRATVHRCTDGQVAQVVEAILGGRRVVVPPGLPRHWLPATVAAVTDENLTAEQIAACDGVVTAVAVAIAETGTVVLDAAPDQGRRVITLLPDVHVCVLRTDQVVAGVPDALDQLDPCRPQTWISGPSATSDIELNRVEGVHGPRNLHVVIVPRGDLPPGA
ncbi:LUD domain-containing protein [Micromonospora sp. 4G57]|uniref:LUD domain-containing protein n=1 Tax=Micromonospora sicca TaxID=2202420 RepID=A0ABU5JBH2_9ACTN|nr:MULTISPECIES: LUD domain-containing protein [unclassified Micromonospora]MDZ5441534.1 LUD domain-containing protein [Micromonospora sp. 4G57]MDZ5489931.1 LUD domain-containing protein [Micromonospora sp. 4G53]